MNIRSAVSLIGQGIYTVREASRLTGVPASSIRRWLRGYRYQYRKQEKRSPAVVVADLSPLEGHLALTFLDLIEIRFVHVFREHGVSWPTIRLAAARAHELFHSEHPFALARFRTDGSTIFADLVKESGEDALLDLKKAQYAFKTVIVPSLYKDLEYDEVSGERVVRWWPLGKKVPVVVDPQVSFGHPTVAKYGVPTATLQLAYRACRDFKEVGRWYEVEPNLVRAAVKFEQQLAA